MYIQPSTDEREYAPIKVGAVIREASFDDYPEISSLSLRYGLPPKGQAEWEHLWTANPVYKLVPDWPIGWVLEVDDKIGGYIGNIPLTYEYQGGRILAAASYRLVVDHKYRNYSLPLVGRFFRQPQAGLLLNTGVNSHAGPAYRIFRAEQVPVGIWNRAVYWITDYSGFMARALVAKKVPIPNALSIPLGGAMFLKDFVCNPAPKPRRDGYTVLSYDHFDERFDTFWEELVKESSGQLLATRSREILDWHFKYHLSCGRAWLVTAEQNTRLLAYAIFCRQDSPSFGLTRLRLVDFQVLAKRTELLIPLVAWGLDKCREQRVHMLEAIGFAHRKQEILEGLAPYRRDLPSWLYFYKANDSALAQSLADPRVWDPCCFDGESSL
jgi:hypothetical protein